MPNPNTTAEHEQSSTDALTTIQPVSSEAVLPSNKQRINITGDTVTLATADYPASDNPNQSHRELVRWSFSYAKENDFSWDEASRQLGLSTTTLFQIWKGKYRLPNGQCRDLSGICERIAHCKQLAEDRAASNRLPFIETSVWRRVDKLCREALVMQTIAHIYGESQIGKTACLKEFARRNNHGQTPYVLCPAAGGVQSLVKAIGDACHISSRSCFDNLRARVSDYLDPTKLLILDEVHEVFGSYQKSSIKRCMSMLRQLQEVTGCGMVLCGTNDFRNELEQGEYSQALKQLRKRGIWELQLESVPTAADLDLIAKHYRLGTPTGVHAKLVEWIAKDHGLGKYTKFLARASQLAHKEGKRFTWEHFSRTVAIATRLKTNL